MADSVNHLVVSRLAVERCQNYVAHLHALMYLCEPRDLGLENVLSESARQIMESLSSDLSLIGQALKFPEEPCAFDSCPETGPWQKAG